MNNNIELRDWFAGLSPKHNMNGYFVYVAYAMADKILELKKYIIRLRKIR